MDVKRPSKVGNDAPFLVLDGTARQSIVERIWGKSVPMVRVTCKNKARVV